MNFFQFFQILKIVSKDFITTYIYICVNVYNDFFIQGLSHTALEDSESSILLATRWRQKHAAHRQQGVLDNNTDDLGLRIVEGNDLPPSLTQIFQS